MLHALRSVRLAFEAFYATLGDEQKLSSILTGGGTADLAMA